MSKYLLRNSIKISVGRLRFVSLILIAGLLIFGSASVVFAGDIATDGFESGNFHGGAGWEDSWQVSGSVDIVNNGDPQLGSWHMRLRHGNGVAYREVDLDDVDDTELTVWVKAHSFEGSEYAVLRIGEPGDLTEVQRWNDNGWGPNIDDDDNQYHVYSFELDEFDIDDTLRVQFESHMGSSQDYLYVDALVVSGEEDDEDDDDEGEDDEESEEDVSPILECVLHNGGSSYTAYFGYENGNESSVNISVGPENKFTPSPQNRGQPTSFNPGRSPYYPSAAFSVNFDGSNLVWTLEGSTATASSSSLPCPSSTPTPTPTPGSSSGIIELDSNFDDWDGHAFITDPSGDATKSRGDILKFYWGDNPEDDNLYWMVERPSGESKLVRYSLHLDMNNNGDFDESVDRIVEAFYQPGFFRSWVIVKIRKADNNQLLYIKVLKDWGETIGEGGAKVEFGVPMDDLGFTFGTAFRMYIESDRDDRAPDTGDIQWSPMPILGWIGLGALLIIGGGSIWWFNLRKYEGMAVPKT